MKPKVIIFSSVHPWNDTRVLLKEAISLKKLFDVVLVVPGGFSLKFYEGIKVVGLSQWVQVSDRIRIHKQLIQVLKREKGDIYHFHDPELIPLGVWLKFKTHKPVIYDIHENYSAYVLDKAWIPKLIRYPISIAFGLIERIAATIFDHNIAATDSIKAIFPSRRNVTTVSNYPIIPDKPMNEEKTTEELKFLYLGSMEEIRGIRNMLHAFHEFKAIGSRHKVSLHVAGKLIGAESYQASLLDYFKDQDIHYYGQLPFEEGQKLMKECHVGIIPFLPLPNHIDAVPNKLFEYMSNGLYLLVSNFELWKEIVVKDGVGQTFDPLKLKTMVAAYQHCDDTFESIRLNANTSRLLVMRKYRWETEEQKLYTIYRELLDV